MAVETSRQRSIDSDESVPEILSCRQRAIQAAHSTGKGGGAIADEIAGELLAAFWRAADADEQGAALRYLRPLQADGLAKDDAEKIAVALEAIAGRLLQSGNPFGTLQFAEPAHWWYGRARDDESRAVVQILVTESWVEQADKDGSGLN